MIKDNKFIVPVLRVLLGWLLFYAGITKVLDPAWTAAGYLNSAKFLPELFSWFASPAILPFTNFINEWGLTLVGVSLILGIGVRIFAVFGAVLMILYYLPRGFPKPDAHSYIVDSHIIYILVLLYLASRAPRGWRPQKLIS
ncbi:MAG: DoxX family protein [bacterium]|nr:DoxX family protein [bacterium]